MDDEIDFASITDHSSFIHHLLELEQNCSNDSSVDPSFVNFDILPLFECKSESFSDGGGGSTWGRDGALHTNGSPPELQVCRKRSKEAVRKMRWRQGLSGPQKEIIKKREREQKRRRFTNLTLEEKMAHRAKDRLRKARERQLESAEQKKQRLARERIRKQNLRLRRKSDAHAIGGNSGEVEEQVKQEGEMKYEDLCNMKNEKAVEANIDTAGVCALEFGTGLGFDLDMDGIGFNDVLQWNTNEGSGLSNVQHHGCASMFDDETYMGYSENDGHFLLGETLMSNIINNK